MQRKYENNFFLQNPNNNKCQNFTIFINPTKS